MGSCFATSCARWRYFVKGDKNRIKKSYLFTKMLFKSLHFYCGREQSCVVGVKWGADLMSFFFFVFFWRRCTNESRLANSRCCNAANICVQSLQDNCLPLLYSHRSSAQMVCSIDFFSSLSSLLIITTCSERWASTRTAVKKESPA